jgi:hypothetical protein
MVRTCWLVNGWLYQGMYLCVLIIVMLVLNGMGSLISFENWVLDGSGTRNLYRAGGNQEKDLGG